MKDEICDVPINGFVGLKSKKLLSEQKLLLEQKIILNLQK